MKSLYKKLVVLSTSALLLGFIILTIGLNVVFRNYVVEKHHKEMATQGAAFNELIVEKSGSRLLQPEVIVSELRSLEGYADLRVWLLIGDRFYTTDPSVEFDLSHFSSEEINQVVESGQAKFKTATYKQFPDTEFYSLIYPIDYDGKTIMVMYLNKAVPSINKTVNDINKITLIALILALLFSTVAIFMSTRSVNADIKKLNKGLRFVAKGNFDYQFNTNRADEVGELTRTFNYMIEELKQMEDSRRRFISDLSHDLRSPITSIRGYIVGVLDGTIPPEKWEKYLNIARDETDRLTKLINDILDLSKMQTGELTVNRTDFSIHDMIFAMLDRFEERIDKKDVEVQFKLTSEDDLVEGDYDLIERVVYNLVDNAVKFVNRDGVIEFMTNLKGNKMLIGVRNSGEPIPPEKLAHIWQRFSKLDASRGLNKHSSGLGLSIIKEILDAHGEKIDVYSNEYLGVMFVFSLNKPAFTEQREEGAQRL